MFGIYVDIIIYTDIIFIYSILINIWQTIIFFTIHNKFINYNKSANFDAHFSE